MTEIEPPATPAMAPLSTASSPNSITKRKPTGTTRGADAPPTKKARTPKTPSKSKSKAGVKPAPIIVHKAEPMLSILQKALDKGFKNDEVKLDSNKLESILEYVRILRSGCDEAGITNKLFNIPDAPVEGEAGGIRGLSKNQIRIKAKELADEIVGDMQSKMKWSSACHRGSARVSTEGICLDGPEIFLELLHLDETALKKACQSFEFTDEEFEDRFGYCPSGSVRYTELPMIGPIKVRWWPSTGQYKVWGTYGKPPKN